MVIIVVSLTCTAYLYSTIFLTMRLYQIDAFTDKLFSGNPAAVVPLDYWIDDELMQNIAMENNLSETAFICPDLTEEEKVELRKKLGLDKP